MIIFSLALLIACIFPPLYLILVFTLGVCEVNCIDIENAELMAMVGISVHCLIEEVKRGKKQQYNT